MIKVGIVGYGYAGRGFHAYLVGRVPDFQLTAVVARNPDRRRLAEQDHSVPTFGSLTEMLEKAVVDLVILATPHDTHAPLAIEAMNAGKAVVTDKAMCLSAREADAMIEASKRNNVMLSVFHNRRWDWDYLTVKKVLADGLVGEPYLFETSVLGYGASRGWRGQAASSGGILFDWGAHLLDQALQLVPGTVRSVTCDLQYRGWGKEIGSFADLTLRFESGVLYRVHLGNQSRTRKPRWLILGEKGSLVKNQDPRGTQEMPMLRGNIDSAAEDPAERAKVTTDLNGLTAEIVVESVKSDWTNYYRNIADYLCGRAELAVKPEEVRRVIAVFDAAQQSAATGQTVATAI